ncbi:MAG: nitronate monooxygenase [Lachnoclostridium sp.]|nr:nitronate monooxygenase [Lachnoclostridium sp.]
MEKKAVLKPLTIGHLTAKRPIIQGGMGVGISLSSLAGAVAKAGGIGIMSTAQIGFKRPDFAKNPMDANLKAIQEEFAKARAIAPQGILGFNIMVATKEYGRYVKEAVKADANVIISGAGLPIDMPKFVAEAEEELRAEGKMEPEFMGTGAGEEMEPCKKRRTMIAPIVSSVKSAMVICRMWDRRHKTAPDFVVIEGPCAGGHLGFSREQLTDLGVDTEKVSETYKQAEYEEEIRSIMKTVKEFADKYEKEIPIIVAGGIYDHKDVMRQVELGVDGVQVATRFVTTEECDADPAYKQAYIDAKEADIVIVKSPVGMPGRAIKNKFLERVQKGSVPVTHCFGCLANCNAAETPYCITRALINAAEGRLDDALVFCGSNAYRSKKIETVPDVMMELCGEA